MGPCCGARARPGRPVVAGQHFGFTLPSSRLYQLFTSLPPCLYALFTAFYLVFPIFILSPPRPAPGRGGVPALPDGAVASVLETRAGHLGGAGPVSRRVET